MKLPSISKLVHDVRNVAVRFSMEVFCVVIGTSFVLWQIGRENPDEPVIRIIMCSILGLVLFLSATVFSESHHLSRKQRSILRGGVAVVLLLCWFCIQSSETELGAIRYALLLVSFQLLVSFAPRTSADGFWEYNKQLFIRLLIAQLYSWVLFAGIAAAIGATDFLFNLDLDYKIYFRLFAIIMGLFNVLVFLAGVPSEFSSTNPYPAGLKIFSQYILIPLATLYLAIILAYEGKILIAWSLPTGVVSALVLGYAYYGILSLLLVHPVRNLAENKWVGRYSKLFYVLMIPIVPLLAIAISVRVADYGVTEFRYIVLILTLWLAIITVYFLFSKKGNIKFIPVSLCLVALFSTWGPQSATSVSQRSQVARLIEMFSSQGNLEGGTLTPVSPIVSDSIGNQIVNQLRYVNDRYGAPTLIPVLPAAIRDSLLRTDTIKSRYFRNMEAFEVMRKGLGLQAYYSDESEYDYYHGHADEQSLSIEGYTQMWRIDSSIPNRGGVALFELTSDTLMWKASGGVAISLKPIVTSVLETAGKNTSNSYLLKQNSIEIGNFKLIVLSIGINRYREEYTVKELEALLLEK